MPYFFTLPSGDKSRPMSMSAGAHGTSYRQGGTSCMLSRLGSKLRLWEQQIWQKIWGPINSTFQTFFSDKATQSQGLQVYACTVWAWGKVHILHVYGVWGKAPASWKFSGIYDDVSLLLGCTKSHITLTLHQKICARQKKSHFLNDRILVAIDAPPNPTTTLEALSSSP